MPVTPPATLSRTRGFSMLEMAIALGIVGIVLGGIWSVAANTRRGVLSNRAEQQTLSTVKNVREYYSSRALPTATIAAATLTSTLRAAGVFPEDMCPANCVSGSITTVYNSYGGTTTVAIPNLTAPINYMDVALDSIEERGCIELALHLSARASEIGLYSYQVDSGTVRTSFPISLSTAESDCAATGNTLTIRFKIRN